MVGGRRGRSRRANRETEALADSALAGALRERFGLTQMEAVVACALADGLTYAEIAQRCRVSYHTVHSHVKAIHQKAGVPSNVRLLALIRKESWK
jgi:DNA-binding CsgD family transcriptional regulator